MVIPHSNLDSDCKANDWFRSPSPKRKRKERSPTPKPLRIHVGRLTRNVAKEHITEIFSSYGAVKFVEFPVDRLHPPSGRGYAYVEFESAEQAENAMKHMDGGNSLICYHNLDAILNEKMLKSFKDRVSFWCNLRYEIQCRVFKLVLDV